MKQGRLLRFLGFAAILVLAGSLFSFSSSYQATGVHSPSGTTPSFGSHVGAEEAAEKLLVTMSLEEKVGQLLMPVIYPSEEARALTKAKQLISKVHPGGLLFQKGSAYTQYNMARLLDAESQLPLLITADAEWGLAMRLSGTIRYPRNMGLRQCAVEQMHHYGRDMARQCKIVGIHANFAPVLDVNNNPANPVIGTRSFSEDVLAVTTLGLAYAGGLEEGGVLSVAKHFPGHGNTRLDSHKTLPTINGSRKSLEEIELAPFKAFIYVGHGGIMTGHLAVPSLDPSNTPASLSPAITTRLLQEEMGFRGLIFTDALAMEGAKNKRRLPLGVQALLAGNDILLAPKDPVAMHAEIVAAVKKGILSEELIRERCKKVLVAKWQLLEGNLAKTSTSPALDEKGFYAALNTEEACTLADQLWLASIQIEGRDDLLKGIRRTQKIGLLDINGASGGAKAAFRATMGEIGIDPAVYRAVETGTGAGNALAIERAFEKCNVIFVNCYDARGAFANALVDRIARKKPVVFTLFASPYALKSWASYLGNASLRTVAFENCAEAGRAAGVKYFAHTAPRNEVFPIVRPLHRGETSNRVVAPSALVLPPEQNVEKKPKQSIAYDSPKGGMFAEVDKIASEGIRIGAYLGCQIAVVHKGKLVYDRAWGAVEEGANALPVTSKTLYDVASVTKAVATTPAIMKLVDMGKLKIGDRVDKHLPALKGTPIGASSIKELLLHESGLPAGINFYERLVAPHSLPDGKFFYYRGGLGLRQIDRRVWVPIDFTFEPRFISTTQRGGFAEPFAEGLYISDNFRSEILEMIGEARLKKARNASRYSDVGFILLGLIVEKVAAMPMHHFLEKYIYIPMEMENLFFHPLEYVGKERIAPTQADNFMRGKVWGLVDDESAACLGGIAGNAGVFASATEVAKMGILLMDQGRWGDKQLINEKTVALFRTTKSRDGKRALGFMASYEDNPNLPKEASRETFGHTGFTGTCFWVDPKKDLVFVFLSNRTFPSRLNNKLASEHIRPRLMEAIYKAL